MSGYAGIAREFVERIAPACERAEIAGSIRRGKPGPKDIEIVAVPRITRERRQKDMFTAEDVETDELASLLNRMLAADEVAARGAWGPLHKRLTWQGAPIDLCCVLPPASWGVIFALRTGPGDFNRRLVTSRTFGGAMDPFMQVAGGQLLRQGGVVDTPTERHFFREIGVPHWLPANRTEERLKAWIAAERRKSARFAEGARMT